MTDEKPATSKYAFQTQMLDYRISEDGDDTGLTDVQKQPFSVGIEQICPDGTLLIDLLSPDGVPYQVAIQIDEGRPAIQIGTIFEHHLRARPSAEQTVVEPLQAPSPLAYTSHVYSEQGSRTADADDVDPPESARAPGV